MHRHPRALLALGMAALLLIVAAQTASANRLSTSEQRVRAVWPEEEKLKFGNEGGEFELRCALTLEGSFHGRTFAKVRGSLVGYITRAVVGPTERCEGTLESVRVLSETLPWHIRYDSFEGTLPRIAGIRFQIVNDAELFTGFGVSCLYKSTAERPAMGIARREVGGAITSMVADSSVTIPLFSGGILCPASGGYAGAGRVTILGSASSVSVTLI